MNLKERNNPNKKKIFFIIFLLLLTFITIGFAYLEAKLNVGIKVNVANIMWDVHFENLVIDTGSSKAIKPAEISSDRKKITFSVKLVNKTDYYQFETDVVNDGKIDAMVSDVKISGLPDSLKSFMEYTLTYEDGVEINPDDLLAVGQKERINVRISFIEGVDLTNLPEIDDFDLVLSIPYIRATDDAMERDRKSFIKILGIDKDAVLDSIQSTYVASTTGVDFADISSDTNGKGLYIRSGTENDKNPIYYFRGAVTNNNIIFANYCWKMVRTTETGGMKLIYNGEPTGANKNQCGNTTGTVTQLDSTSKFNESTSIEYVGYVYDTNKDSTIKIAIDNWYKINIRGTGYEEKLEDTVWCFDRSVGSTSGTATYYGARERLYTNKTPSLVCEQDADKYTLKSTARNYKAKLNGNKLLDYPIALLTADEVAFAGGVYSKNNTAYYLYTGQMYYLFSPFFGSNTLSGMMIVNSGYLSSDDDLKWEYGVRPAISIAAGTMVISGDGSIDNPYVVSENNGSSQDDLKKTKILGINKEASLDNVSSEYVESSSGIDFKLYSSDTNGKGLYIYTNKNGNVYNSENPIYYYRGEVTDNNVIFANFCWKIVRTTETGGIKLIYNGTVGSGKTCNNTGISSQLSSTSAFNTTTNKKPYIGYTYGSSTVMIGSTNSTIKTAIDNWYRSNILNKYDSYLEDTIYCADRTATVSGYYTYYGFYTRSYKNKEKPMVVCLNKDDSYSAKNTSINYNASLNGNELLIYPVSLLTGDEAQLAGYAWYYDNKVGNTYTVNTTTYLHSGADFWLLSPAMYDSAGYASGIIVYGDNGALSGSTVDVGSPGGYLADRRVSLSVGGVRPSISLKAGTKVSGGDGTVDNPYIVS